MSTDPVLLGSTIEIGSYDLEPANARGLDTESGPSNDPEAALAAAAGGSAAEFSLTDPARMPDPVSGTRGDTGDSTAGPRPPRDRRGSGQDEDQIRGSLGSGRSRR